MRVVGSMTTMPDRYNKLLPTIKSIINQGLDELYLTLPFFSKRMKIEYPDIPEEIKKCCKIVRCTDYGPITKILGALYSESDPNTVIITFDDDYIYPANLVSTLLDKHKLYPNSALGSAGLILRSKWNKCGFRLNDLSYKSSLPNFDVSAEGRIVDSVFGYPGALYVRKFFPKKSEIYHNFIRYSQLDKNTFLNDDITISGYLSLKNIERRIFSDIEPVSSHGDKNVYDISYDIPKFVTNLNGAISTCTQNGMFYKTAPLGTFESINGTVFVIAFPILILIVCVILCFLMI